MLELRAIHWEQRIDEVLSNEQVFTPFDIVISTLAGCEISPTPDEFYQFTPLAVLQEPYSYTETVRNAEI